MRIAENKYYMYKADGVEIVDLTNDVISADLEGGSVLNLGDGYTDSPIKTMSIEVQNSNNKLYSPFFKANKVKYDMSLTLVGNGTSTYNSPKNNTISVVTPNMNYGCTYIKGKIELSHNLPIGQTLEIWVTYIDIDEKNPINHLFTDVFKTTLQELYGMTLSEIYSKNLSNLYTSSNATYSPLIQEGNTFVWEQSIKDVNFEYFESMGNGTNQIILDKKLDDVFLLTIATAISKSGIYAESLEYLYSLTLEQIYSMPLLKEKFKIGETAQITGFTTATNSTTITFDRNIGAYEKVFITGKIISLLDSELKFVGKVNANVPGTIKSCKFNCQDLSYDFRKEIINPNCFRRYFTEKDGESFVTKEESITKCIVSNNTLSITFNNLNEKFANNETVYLYDEQNFYETTLAITSDTTATVTGIANGNYSIYKKYVPSLFLEQFIQNCIDDLGLNYSLFVKDFSNFAIIPKVSEMQMDNLWSFLQNIVAKRGMCLHFVYTKDTETYFNVDGTTKQGTNSFELILQEIPQDNSVAKFEIFEADIEDNAQFDSTGTLLINSYEIGYYSAETDQVERKVIDDFDLSVNQVTIPTERNIIITDELLSTNEGTNTIRINNEYRQVIEAIDSSTYRVNLAFSESGTFNLFMIGTYSKKYGLKRAYYDLDSTSEIDTEQEAINFGNLLLNQYLDIYATYKFKVYSRYFPFMKNFDVVKINSPRFNLLGQNLFVQSINENSQFTEFTVSEIMHLGKWKYYEMKVERGQNTITDTTKINTADIFPPVTNLTALDPSIDDLQNYVVYSRVSWNKLIGMNVTSYEVQYKKYFPNQTEEWNFENWKNAEVVTLSDNSLKLELKEQALYNIRVKGRGKEQVNGKWAYTNVDASTYLIENPIQNRTWYIRLFAGNDEVEYFSQFDKLGYTNQYLIDSIDTIEIVPNADKGVKDENYVLWSSRIYSPYPTTITTGLNNLILQKFNKTISQATNKNINFRPVQGGYYKIVGDFYVDGGSTSSLLSGLILSEWNNVKGIESNVFFRLFKSVIGLIAYYNTDYIRNIENITFIAKKEDYTGWPANLNFHLIFGSGSGIPYDKSLTNYKNLQTIIEGFSGFSIDGYSVTGFLGVNRIESCKNVGGQTGFSLCEGISNSVSDGSFINFDRCKLMYKNLGVNHITTKYNTCYSSLNADLTYLIPTNGADTVNAGFNL